MNGTTCRTAARARVTVESGLAGKGQAVAAHEVQNIGKIDCTILMFEPK